MITIVLRPLNPEVAYDVELDGEIIVSHVRDPERAAAREMNARGLTGPFRVVDATGRVRMCFDSIEEAARECPSRAEGSPEDASLDDPGTEEAKAA